MRSAAVLARILLPSLMLEEISSLKRRGVCPKDRKVWEFTHSEYKVGQSAFPPAPWQLVVWHSE